jgi:hypothetical protein
MDANARIRERVVDVCSAANASNRLIAVARSPTNVARLCGEGAAPTAVLSHHAFVDASISRLPNLVLADQLRKNRTRHTMRTTEWARPRGSFRQRLEATPRAAVLTEM